MAVWKGNQFNRQKNISILFNVLRSENKKKFADMEKCSTFANRVSLIRPAPIESPRVGIQQGCLVVAVRYK